MSSDRVVSEDQIKALRYLEATEEKEESRRRAAAVLRYGAGMTAPEVAREVGLSENQVRYWWRKYAETGITALKDHWNEEMIASLPPLPGPSLRLPRFGNAELDDPALYLNRELSLLQFQRRVLEEAQDEANPLLERIKFLSIVGSNLDEFYMVRVGGLKMQVEAGVADLSPDGMTPAEQLAAIRREAEAIMRESRTCLRELLYPALAKNGIHILPYGELSDKQKRNAHRYFERNIFPALTPLAFDPGHPFPHISNLSLNLAVMIRNEQGQTHFARVKVPDTLPRFVPIKRSSGGVRQDGTVPYNHYFVWVEEVIEANLQALFPGMEVIEAYPFRVTRNADFELQEMEADDLLETMEQSVRQRRFGMVVRVVVNGAMPSHIRKILIENLRADPKDCFVLEEPMGLSSLIQLVEVVDRYDLRYATFVPHTPAPLRDDRDNDFFTAIRRKSYLLHHPYDSFGPVLDFLEKAAEDPQVLAIKQTLYRVGKNAPVVKSLLKARENGKQVAVLVELKARFDEASNIGWARMLEREGVHVIYGLLGLKTHSKIALVVRREGDAIRRYMHLSTGNYNAVTAHLYEDLGYFTSDEDLGADASDLFNYLTGYSAKVDYRKLIVAPINLRSQVVGLIEREIEHQRGGRQGHIILKMNALVDKAIIQGLYRASRAGVRVDLIVRGICCLRPGVPGISEHITVRSIVGRFLEHGRIYYFQNGGEEQVYLGSADMMPRNIDRRVELIFPIEEPNYIRHLRDEVLETYLKDNVKVRMMQADGSYSRREHGEDAALSAQQWFLEQRLKQTALDKHPWEVF